MDEGSPSLRTPQRVWKDLIVPFFPPKEQRVGKESGEDLFSEQPESKMVMSSKFWQEGGVLGLARLALR